MFEEDDYTFAARERSIASPPHESGAQDALNRMKRAHDRGTGCHLTAAMLDSLAVTMIGEMWEQPDPREDQA